MTILFLVLAVGLDVLQAFIFIGIILHRKEKSRLTDNKRVVLRSEPPTNEHHLPPKVKTTLTFMFGVISIGFYITALILWLW